MAKKRLRKHKQQAMNRRLRTGKKPMSVEQKAAQKEIQKKDRARTKAVLEKQKIKK